MASADSYPSPPPSPPKGRPNPVLRNALRYSLSEKEYEVVHHHLLKSSPPAIKARVPSPQQYKALSRGKDDYNAAAVRASARLFIATQSGLTLWEWMSSQLLRRGKASRPKAKSSLWKSPNLRLSLSLSMILFLHRLLFRFFSRLRSNLLTKDAAPFRRRNPRTSKYLTSRLAPAIGASLAGFALGVYPAHQLRLTITIYIATRSIEFAYSALEGDGWFKDRPWWWGSWMMMPLATGQLLHAFVFDRDCYPAAYGDFILKNTPNYVQHRPASYPPSLPWPNTNEIIDSLAEMSRLNWPPFISPILFPNLPTTLPPSLAPLSPITSPAHPSHTYLSCATLHPSSPSCTLTLTHYLLSASPPMAKLFTLIYTLLSLPKYRSFLSDPSTQLNLLARKILRTTSFLTGSIGTSWASICLFQSILPRTVLPTQRWFLGGFMGGLWAFVDRKGGTGQVMYSVRMSLDCLVKVGRKRGWWWWAKGMRGGDVVVFVVGLALVNGIFEVRREAVKGVMGRGVGWLRGEELFPKKEEGEGKVNGMGKES